MATDQPNESGTSKRETRATGVEMPRPTVWPLVLALGLTLLAAGLLTNLVFSLLGAALCAVSLRGWIGELAPGAGTHVEALALEAARPRPVQPSTAGVASVTPGRPGYRARIPERIHPYSAGVKGGAVGGVLMAIIAILYGLVSGRGIWYPVNLLAAIVTPRFNEASLASLEAFSPLALLAGVLIHAVASLSLGLVLAVIMPMLPRRPFVWGCVVAPLLWTGAVYGLMGVLNPVMNAHVQWGWFVISQFGYGVAAVFVIVRSEQVAAIASASPGPENTTTP
jgi:hypothetical protein